MFLSRNQEAELAQEPTTGDQESEAEVSDIWVWGTLTYHISSPSSEAHKDHTNLLAWRSRRIEDIWHRHIYGRI